jgi:hypothetical protein
MDSMRRVRIVVFLFAWALVASPALADDSPISVTHLGSSYWLPARAQCQGVPMVSDPKLGLAPGLPSFYDAAHVYCVGLIRRPPDNQPESGAAASIRASMAVEGPGSNVINKPVPQSLPMQVRLSLWARADAEKSNAYAGYFKFETGGATSRWRLHNPAQRAVRVKIECAVSFDVTLHVYKTAGGVPVAETSNSARLSLLDRLGQEMVALCQLTDSGSAPFSELRAFDVCLGSGATVEVLSEGEAGARVMNSGGGINGAITTTDVALDLARFDASSGGDGCVMVPGQVSFRRMADPARKPGRLL